MKLFLKENWFRLVIILISLVVALSAGWYFVFRLPAQNQIKIDQAQERWDKEQQIKKENFDKEISEKEFNKRRLQLCLDDAQERYSNGWDEECDAVGLPADCRLPEYNADTQNEYLDSYKDDCYKTYQ